MTRSIKVIVRKKSRKHPRWAAIQEWRSRPKSRACICIGLPWNAALRISKAYMQQNRRIELPSDGEFGWPCRCRPMVCAWARAREKNSADSCRSPENCVNSEIIANTWMSAVLSFTRPSANDVLITPKRVRENSLRDWTSILGRWRYCIEFGLTLAAKHIACDNNAHSGESEGVFW